MTTTIQTEPVNACRPCPDCSGSGRIESTEYVPNHGVPVTSCPTCDGSGRAPEYGEEGRCTECDGSGFTRLQSVAAPLCPRCDGSGRIGPALERYVCATCGEALHYIAEYGAPGIGQSWECKNGHHWAKIGTTFHDPATQAHILGPESYR